MYDFDDVLDILQYFNTTKLSNREISKKTKISRQTINRWKNTYYKNLKLLNKCIYNQKVYNKILKKKEDQQNKNKIKASNNIEIITYFDEIVEQYPFHSRKEYALLISNKFNINFKDYNVSSLIKKFKYSYKKPRKYIVKNIKYIDELIKKRKLFQEQINLEIQSKIIAIDESGFNKLFNLSKGLSKKGKVINIAKTDDSKNISLLMAINNTNIIHYNVSEQKINGLIYIDFIKEIIDKLDNSGYIFLMDNVSFHHNKELIKIIKDSGNRIMYIPPYSPNHNPIENLFSVIKDTYYKLDKTEIKKEQLHSRYYTNDYDYNHYTANKKKRKRKINKIKYFIMIAIQKIYEKIDETYYKKIFERSINFNHDNITNELRDRLIIK
jgi:transposase/glycerol-3-phosphate cytidylyltransferase-like family protein